MGPLGAAGEQRQTAAAQGGGHAAPSGPEASSAVKSSQHAL